ncbi:GFA family protein [Lichenicoccus roseus]|uniref:GFA family protein n=1 Tax=Lichenicoccus roseus TaxID=2683649 RepID=A0A5R9JB65_9PROT|nr:GFA family protein [Lichenicoccus roseus]TLU74239.1 GFA family protein [Lichenicoccus roseus]
MGDQRVLEGGCLCGAVRYAIQGEPLGSVICHCRSCQRASSAPRLAFIGVSAGCFVLTSGTPVEYVSSPGVTRTFCGRCGSPLTYRRTGEPGSLDVTTISLDDPDAVSPTHHSWLEDAAGWDRLAGDLPTFTRSSRG